MNDGLIEGSMPAANNNTSPLKYEAYCPMTDGGRSPNQFCVPATRVTVASFAARGRTLTWRTASEVGVLGFDVLRDGRKIALVRAKGAVQGSRYRYVDRAADVGSRHVYRLRVVRL